MQSKRNMKANEPIVIYQRRNNYVFREGAVYLHPAGKKYDIPLIVTYEKEVIAKWKIYLK
jgi:hypothetical protein